MRTLHLITSLDRGGAERQLLSLAQQQLTKGVSVKVIFLKGKGVLGDEFRRAGVDVIKINLFRFSKIIQALRIVRDTEVIHGHLPMAELIVATSSFFFNKITLVSKHNTEQFYPEGNRRLSQLLARFVESRTLATICISREVLEYLKAIREIEDKKKYHVIHYGISVDCSRGIERIKKSDETNQIKLITIARLVKQKNLEVLVKSISLLPERFTLEIWGTGPMRIRLLEQIAELNLVHRVQLKGVTANPEKVLQEGGVFVLPSLYEGFGLVLLEAMSYGVPIVASNIGVIREILGENYKYLCNPNSAEEFVSALERIVREDKSELLKRYSAILEQFDIKFSEEKTRELYMRLAKDQKKGESEVVS